MSFLKGFKTAAANSFWHDAKKLDYGGLGALATVPAYHGYKAIKEKDKAGMATSAAELGGLGLLARAVKKHG